MKKAEKIFFVDNLTEELKGAKTVVLINFVGMGVKAQQELKKQLKAVNAKMIVVKNTLLKIAAKKAKVDESLLDDSILTGQTALIVTSDDAISPIQVLGKFAKEFETPQMKIGIIEGTLTDAASLAHISTLPGRDALLGQLLGALMAPSYGLISTLNAGPSRLVSMLEAKAKAN